MSSNVRVAGAIRPHFTRIRSASNESASNPSEFLSLGLDNALACPYHSTQLDEGIRDQSAWNPGPRISEEVSASMATLRKSDLTSRVATKLSGSRAQGEAALNAVLSSVQEALANGDRVVLTGFGSFSIREVKPRRVRPIRGGQAGSLITVPAHKRVGFTAGAELTKAAQS